MSYASDVKSELINVYEKARHCQIAELYGIRSFYGKTGNIDGEVILLPDKDNDRLIGKYNTLRKKLNNYNEFDNGIVLQQPCCKRAYIRGAFLSAGTISNPNKSYHFEIISKSEESAREIQANLKFFGVHPKIVRRKNYFVVYLKEGSDIVEVLNIMKAHKALMDLENVRILKEMRGSINRKVNCETANISKMVGASVKQIEDIEYIEKTIGLSSIPKSLGEMATVRLEHPNAPLKELGNYLIPPIGKSGVNHRLRRISEIASKLKEEQ